jgi:hypothetical protein
MLIKRYGWARKKYYSSRKYLLSLGMIIDYLDNPKNSLCNKPIKLVYIEPRKSKSDDKIPGDVIELVDNSCLKEKSEEGDELAECLVAAFEAIFQDG